MLKKKVVILGGGISGLTSAWSLAKSSPQSHDVLLLEASHRVGGWIQSERMANIGTVHELGPRSMRIAQDSGKAALNMLSELGLESKIVPIKRGHKAASRRLIYTNKHGLLELPTNMSWLFKAKPPFTRPLLPSLIKEPFVEPNKSEEGDESIYHFINRRLGNEIADWLIDPMCRGIFAGSSKKLSVRSCFPMFYNYEQTHGSLWKGMIKGLNQEQPSEVPDSELIMKAKKELWILYTLQNGLQTLTDTLHTAAIEAGVSIHTDTPVTGLSFDNNQAKVMSGEREFTADYVISTIPAQALGMAVSDQLSELSSILGSISAVNVAVVNCEFAGQVVPEQWREAFGYLVPSHQKSDILGTVFDSATFPELDRKDAPSTRLTVMMGGDWFGELFGDPTTVQTSTLSTAALKALYTQLGITQDPTDCIVNVHKSCIPQYNIGHSQRLDKIESHVKGLPLSLVGCSYSGVSVNDCIMNSLNEVKKIVTQT